MADDVVRLECSACGHAEDRPVPRGTNLVLAVREEIRQLGILEQLSAASTMPLPSCPATERAVVAAALVGIRPDDMQGLSRQDFLLPFYGWAWELAPQCTPKGTTVPNLEQMAAAFEARKLGRQASVLQELRSLTSPHQVAMCSAYDAARLRELATARDLIADMRALEITIRNHIAPEDTRWRLREMRRKFEAFAQAIGAGE